MQIRKPALYINYFPNVTLGPFYTISPDGHDSGKWIAYQVQEKPGEFRRVTVPEYHYISGMI